MTAVPRTEVTDRLLAVLRHAGTLVAPAVPVGDHEAPPDTSSGRYVVLESIPGGMPREALDGARGGRWCRYRLRAVGFDPQAPRAGGVARRNAEWAADLIGSALMDRTVRIHGDGWEVTGRREDADGGAELDGPVCNVIVDYLLYVAASPAAVA